MEIILYKALQPNPDTTVKKGNIWYLYIYFRIQATVINAVNSTHTHTHLQLPSLDNTNIKDTQGEWQISISEEKRDQRRIRRRERREHKAEGRRGMDEEARGRRKLGEKTETATVEKGQQRQRASAREKIKNRRGGKVCHALSRGRNCPHGAVAFSLTHLRSKDEKPLLALHAQSN